MDIPEIRFTLLTEKPQPGFVDTYGKKADTPEQVKESFLAGMATYYYDKMKKEYVESRKGSVALMKKDGGKNRPVRLKDDAGKPPSFVVFHEGVLANLPTHCVIFCSLKLAMAHIKNFPKNVVNEYGGDDNVSINIHFLGKEDDGIFYARMEFSRRPDRKPLSGAPEYRERITHTIATIMVPMRNLMELAGSEKAILHFACEKCRDMEKNIQDERA